MWHTIIGQRTIRFGPSNLGLVPNLQFSLMGVQRWVVPLPQKKIESKFRCIGDALINFSAYYVHFLLDIYTYY